MRNHLKNCMLELNLCWLIYDTRFVNEQMYPFNFLCSLIYEGRFVNGQSYPVNFLQRIFFSSPLACPPSSCHFNFYSNLKLWIWFLSLLVFCPLFVAMGILTSSVCSYIFYSWILLCFTINPTWVGYRLSACPVRQWKPNPKPSKLFKLVFLGLGHSS